MGVIGFGRIGQVTGQTAKAIGMSAIAFDEHSNSSGHAIAEYVEPLLARSDVVSLHRPLLPSTEGIINKNSIAKMKDGVIILNNSRDPLIVEQDLADSLNAGKVYCRAGCDFLQAHQGRQSTPKAKNCIITPHINWALKESRQRLVNIAVRNLKQFIGGTSVNVVNINPTNIRGESEMEIIQATMNDLNDIISLHKKYHIDSIDISDKQDGFVTTDFTQKQLEDIINKEQGITIAKENGVVVCYAMAASWKFWSEWPFFSYMIQKLPENLYEDRPLSTDNSYQYGPICVDGSVRGTGVFEEVFYASLKNMMKRFPTMVTFINQVNQRSYTAHTCKAHMSTVGTFQYNDNEYYMLACPTKCD